jgi:8-oxo-dGTP pyrophosphatase MutT (NUDIX family)
MTQERETEDPFAFDESEPKGPVLRPKDAASLILVRRQSNCVRVLMGERHARHVFLPGRLVFPGGRLDAGDQRIALNTDLRRDVAAKVAIGITSARARGLGFAAIRETFEETGILVGARTPSQVRTRSEAWRRFFAEGVTPRLEALDFVARAITPPGRPRRFDARFFMADADEIVRELDPSLASGELLRPVWLTLGEARQADVLPITRCIFDEIEARLAEGTDSTRPVPFFIPRRGKALIKQL